jgi:hypothetical protein
VRRATGIPTRIGTLEPRVAVIIPLGPESLRDSSSLPEGQSVPLLRAERIRAGPALPSYLALLHAGFSVPRMLPSGRWALTPPFHPCQMRSTERGGPLVLPKACRRGASITGGLFSVALSVAAFPDASFRPPLRTGTSPLALPGALPCRSRLLRAHCDWSPDFPPVPVYRDRRSPGSPAKTIIAPMSRNEPPNTPYQQHAHPSSWWRLLGHCSTSQLSALY